MYIRNRFKMRIVSSFEYLGICSENGEKKCLFVDESYVCALRVKYLFSIVAKVV